MGGGDSCCGRQVWASLFHDTGQNKKRRILGKPDTYDNRRLPPDQMSEVCLEDHYYSYDQLDVASEKSPRGYARDTHLVISQKCG